MWGMKSGLSHEDGSIGRAPGFKSTSLPRRCQTEPLSLNTPAPHWS